MMAASPLVMLEGAAPSAGRDSCRDFGQTQGLGMPPGEQVTPRPCRAVPLRLLGEAQDFSGAQCVRLCRLAGLSCLLVITIFCC